ncbi:hypothetical protein, conserved [Trypanosoma brucei brucei TREU927]|uniref:Leucine-rich repeat protein (LRRP) n=1 Tax=Trypanosoma brucei brucei (strain 927/4 GUTat10.1) TaxID=185431 RepID=Q386C2_TRYB2|nr:hypothetical protein, conserved [Trypanosoma brucei brucei TREU927]EAN79359.1 hypothetical protein, conserved [Trypanosoma brucei brucei TREU927]
MGEYPDNATDTLSRAERLVSNINAKFAAFLQQLKPNEHRINGYGETLVDGRTSASGFVRNTEIIELYGREESTSSTLFEDASNPHYVHRRKRSSSLYSTCGRSNQSAERNLFFAANDLCMFLNGGVDYRSICLKYQETLEVLLGLIRDDIGMLHSVSIFTPDMVSDAVKTLRNLYTEAKILLEQHGLVSGAHSPERRASTSPGRSPDHTATQVDRIGSQVMGQNNNGLDSGNGSAQSRSGAEAHAHAMYANGGGHSPRPAALVEGILSTSSNKHRIPSRHTDTERYSPLHFCSSKLKPQTTKVTPTEGPAAPDEVDITQGIHGSSTKEPKISNEEAFGPHPRECRNNARRLAVQEVYEKIFHNDGTDMLRDVMCLIAEKEYGFTAPELKKYDVCSQLASRLLHCYATASQQRDQVPNSVTSGPTLPFDYIENCFHCNVEPNDQVLNTLSCIAVGKRTLKIVLANMHITDDDLRPLVPLLSKFDQMITLDISNNRFGDNGAQLLCKSMLAHPALKELNISGNFVTDASADALLQLAASATQLMVVRKQGTNLSPGVCEELERALRRGQGCRSAQRSLGSASHVSRRAQSEADAYNSPSAFSGVRSTNPPPVVALNSVGYKWQRPAVTSNSNSPTPISLSPSPLNYVLHEWDRLGACMGSLDTNCARTQQGVRLPCIIAKGKKEGM